MSVSDESAARSRQLRDKARELHKEADQASDPAERKRLEEKAQRLQSKSEQVVDFGSGDIFPTR